jgi:hypothetical protein
MRVLPLKWVGRSAMVRIAAEKLLQSVADYE